MCVLCLCNEQLLCPGLCSSGLISAEDSFVVHFWLKQLEADVCLSVFRSHTEMQTGKYMCVCV